MLASPKHWILVLFVSLKMLTSPAAAQEGNLLETQAFGGTASDVGHDALPTADGGLILMGTTSSTQFGDSDILLVKLDDQGAVQWQATVGDAANNEGIAVVQTTDGGFVVAGYTNLGFAPSRNALLIRVDPFGNELWLHYYGGPEEDVFQSVRETNDGGFVAAGNSSSFDDGGARFYLVRTDAQGTVLWENTYGEPATYLRGVVETQDGGIAACGYVKSGGGLAPPYDAVLLKVDSGGSLLWRRDFDRGVYDYAYELQQLPGGDLAMAGTAESGMAVWRLDPNGIERWFHAFQTSSGDVGSSLWPTKDGGLVVGGYTGYEIFVGKTDGAGNEVWSQHYGGEGIDICDAVRQCADGSYAAFGYSNSFTTGDHDMFLWILEGPAAATAVDDEATPSRGPALTAFPNPFNPKVELTLRVPDGGFVSVEVYDIAGRRVRTLLREALTPGTHRTTWDGRDERGTEMASGVYVARMQTRQGTRIEKLALVR